VFNLSFTFDLTDCFDNLEQDRMYVHLASFAISSIAGWSGVSTSPLVKYLRSSQVIPTWLVVD
jgi:hypothetical protein